jgi:hypothetical protein
MHKVSWSTAAVVAAFLVTAALPGPLAAIDPPPEEPELASLTALMEAMHRSMQGMHDDMKGMTHMRGMQDRMSRAMGMSEEMRGLMRQYREQRRSDCPGGRPTAPRPHGR